MANKLHDRRLRWVWLALMGAILAVGVGVAAGARQGRFAASSVVQPQAYVSLEPVPRGKPFEIAVVAKITPGFHVNAHMPSEDYLIPTKITANLPAGLVLEGTMYPPGVIRKFEFATSGLRVYEDSFTVRMKLRAGANVPLGHQKIALTVGYQACNEEACLPPVKIPATAELEIAAANTPSHPANPEIFSQTSTNQPAAHP